MSLFYRIRRLVFPPPSPPRYPGLTPELFNLFLAEKPLSVMENADLETIYLAIEEKGYEGTLQPCLISAQVVDDADALVFVSSMETMRWRSRYWVRGTGWVTRPALHRHLHARLGEEARQWGGPPTPPDAAGRHVKIREYDSEWNPFRMSQARHFLLADAPEQGWYAAFHDWVAIQLFRKHLQQSLPDTAQPVASSSLAGTPAESPAPSLRKRRL